MDLSENWKTPGMAAQQREIVERQLGLMREGMPPLHFATVGKWARNLTAYPPVPLRVLDVGCSSGYYFDILDFYAPGKVDYTGCDYSADMLAMARRYHPELYFDEAEATTLPYPNRRFDLVLSGATVNIIEDWQKALSELARVSDRYLLLHRAWVHSAPTESTIEEGYGQEYLQWHWNEADLLAAVPGFALLQQAPVEGALSCGCRSMSYLWERRG